MSFIATLLALVVTLLWQAHCRADTCRVEQVQSYEFIPLQVKKMNRTKVGFCQTSWCLLITQQSNTLMYAEPEIQKNLLVKKQIGDGKNVSISGT